MNGFAILYKPIGEKSDWHFDTKVLDGETIIIAVFNSEEDARENVRFDLSHYEFEIVRVSLDILPKNR